MRNSASISSAGRGADGPQGARPVVEDERPGRIAREGAPTFDAGDAVVRDEEGGRDKRGGKDGGADGAAERRRT